MNTPVPHQDTVLLLNVVQKVSTAILHTVKASTEAQTVSEKDSLRNFLAVLYKGASGETGCHDGKLV